MASFKQDLSVICPFCGLVPTSTNNIIGKNQELAHFACVKKEFKSHGINLSGNESLCKNANNWKEYFENNFKVMVLTDLHKSLNLLVDKVSCFDLLTTIYLGWTIFPYTRLIQEAFAIDINVLL